MIKPILSIIIVSYNTAEITLDCLKSLLADKGLDFFHKSDNSEKSPAEIIIIDNNSSDNSPELIKKYFASKNLP
ncbi:MAG TPA: glycosyltransferase, partial [Patescibacteria group bacterium]